MQEEAVMVDLEDLSRRVRERQLPPAEEAKAAQALREIIAMTIAEWRIFNGLFPQETRDQTVQLLR